MTLGERIKSQRKKSGLSQEKVAELVGVSRQSVTKWEAGQSAPSTENLFRLAEIFGTTVDMLLYIQKENTTKSDDQAKELDSQVRYLFRLDETRKLEAQRMEAENEKRAEELRNKSSKAWFGQILFVSLCVIAAIPLTITVFTDMNPTVIRISAALIGIGLVGNMICAFIRAFLGKSM